MKKLKYDSRVLFKYRGKKIIDEKSVTKKRNKKDKKKLLKEDQIISIFCRMIDYLLEYKIPCFCADNEYLFYSRQHDIGLCIEIRKDLNSKNRQIFIKTWLKDVADTANVDRKSSNEVHSNSYYILNQDSFDYLFNISDGFNKKMTGCGTNKLTINDYKNDKIQLDVFFQQDKVWHITNIGLCEIY